mmetsp:Transcript_1996/g.5918  ORF Transcript_1996/g.5918 Transcript_1996/m.5918 type:complete len:295 (+) Transcript_1996:616-1500(+)
MLHCCWRRLASQMSMTATTGPEPGSWDCKHIPCGCMIWPVTLSYVHVCDACMGTQAPSCTSGPPPAWRQSRFLIVPAASSCTHCWPTLPGLHVPSCTAPPSATRQRPSMLLIVMSACVVVVIVVVVTVVVLPVEDCNAVVAWDAARQSLNGWVPQKAHSLFMPSAKQPKPPKKQVGSHSYRVPGSTWNWHSPSKRPIGTPWPWPPPPPGSSGVGAGSSRWPRIMHVAVSSSCTVSAWPAVPKGLRKFLGSWLVMLQLVPFTTFKLTKSTPPKYSATSQSENSTTTSPRQFPETA